jgi:hypothetical protein
VAHVTRTVFLNRAEPAGRDDLLDLCVVGFNGTAAGRRLRLARAQRAAGPRAHRPDLLAVDQDRRLVLIDVAVSQDDALLVRALAHHAAVVQDFSEVAVLFEEPRPEAGRIPGLILVMPDVTPTMLQAAAAAALPIDFFRYRIYTAHGSRAFALEPVPISPGERASIDPFRTGLGPAGADLSDAEVLEILRGNGSETT